MWQRNLEASGGSVGVVMVRKEVFKKSMLRFRVHIKVKVHIEVKGPFEVQ